MTWTATEGYFRDENGLVPISLNDGESIQVVQTARDPFAQPFAVDSIWNMPISTNAVRVPAQIPNGSNDIRKLAPEQDLLLIDPNAPINAVTHSTVAWGPGVDRAARCAGNDSTTLVSGHIANDFTTDYAHREDRPNHATAMLDVDGDTLHSFNAFEGCGSQVWVAANMVNNTESIRGAGITGGHGGSGMSSIGGTIRLGEWVQGGRIPHALKINLWAASAMYWDAQTDGYRWPAIRSDSYADDTNDPRHYQGTVPACRMGVLLALPTSFNIAGLNTEPARIMATAFLEYGGYVVDDTARDVVAVACEVSSNGIVTEEFESEFGIDPHGTDPNWIADVRSIFGALDAIDNNTVTTTGGGPNNEPESNRLAPYALPLAT